MSLANAINNRNSFGNEQLDSYTSGYAYTYGDYIEELLYRLDYDSVLYFNGSPLSLVESNVQDVSHGIPIHIVIKSGSEYAKIGGFYNSWDTTYYSPAVEVNPVSSVVYLSESEFEDRDLTWPTEV